MFDAGGSGGEIRWRFRRRSNSRDSMWAGSVNGIHAIYVRVSHSSTLPRRLELSIGRRWSPRERTTSTPPLHTRLADRALCAYKAQDTGVEDACRTVKWSLAALMCRRDETATATTTAGQRPAHLRTQNGPQTGL